MSTPINVMDPATLKNLLAAEDSAVAVLDVRTPAEFESVHIPGSYNLPLDLVAEHAHDVTRKLAKQIVLVCQSGTRAGQAQQKLADLQIESGSVLDGGISAWEKSGGAVVRGTQRWAMDRQVRMTAGSLVLLGFIGSKLASPKLGYLSAAIGAGLVYSAASNSCAMASVLSKMPWNKASTNGKANPLAQIPDAGQQLNPHGK
ncbi:rhodanese-like domain-containing protein [Arthrobacter sp. NIO-1057]|uniref:rhodanese-like domain-containing protein n=1 Tax=Arthrobacter sp. NIO-1057 TaxID=993071 RepID=UPI00071E55FF|nr:rhodanese-like domain-containing protein [Arthrobacter sp. NIO-1057]KSU63070.1 sulfurtransferase [Arthrobacter sp. NIO-1057]SCC53153.1 Rhodanese-related sulfurtransferase [Arthrobacter sp. NIO-1057]